MDKRLQVFYDINKIKPTRLSDCSFINIKYGYDIGTDVCPAVDTPNYECTDCPYSKITHEFYPELTDLRTLKLIKVIMDMTYSFPGLLGKDYSVNDIKLEIVRAWLNIYASLTSADKKVMLTNTKKIFLT